MEAEQSPATSMTQSLKDYIRELELSRIQALVKPDMERLWQLHSAEYQLITPSGRCFSREQYLALIDSGQLKYLRWEPGLMEARTSEKMAIVRYQVTLQLGSPEGTGTPLHCWHTDSYELIAGVWQAVWSQATRIKQ